ncbi:MAG: hypothetical protein U0Y68_26665 [Blastocatellia bacterium]
MNSKNYIAIAIATLAFTVTAFAQWHPEIDKVKGRTSHTQSITSPRDVASGQATGRRKAPRRTQDKLGNFEIQGIKSPRDAASGQATGRRKAPNTAQDKLGNFEIQGVKSPRDVASGQATGVVAGQNSGGTITNQRRNRPVRGYIDGGVTHEDTWEQKRRLTRKRR